MKIHFLIPRKLKIEVDKELNLSNLAYSSGNFKESFNHLERAHVLGQAWPIEHTIVHWKMFVFAIKIKNRKEVLGQIPRLLIGGLKSFIGEIPVGNTGGSNVPPLSPMEIPADLKLILRDSKK